MSITNPESGNALGERVAAGVTVQQIADEMSVVGIYTPDNPNQAGLIRSVHATDLTEPSRYLLPNELVATNGLWLATTPAADWVMRVSKAGASALAFGLSDDIQVVPLEIIKSCKKVGLPLLVIDSDTSFTKLADVITSLLANDAAHDLRQELNETRRLLQASVDDDAYNALARHVRAVTGYTAAFVSADGEVLAAAGKKPRARDVIEATLAARNQRLPASIEPFSAFPVPSATRRGSILLIGASLQDIQDAQRLAIEHTTAFAVVADQRRSERRTVSEILTRELLEMIEDGDIGERQLRSRLETLGLRHDRELLLLVGGDTQALRSALNIVDASVAVALRGGRLEALVQGDDASDLLVSLVDLLQQSGPVSPLGHGSGIATSGGLRVLLAATQAAFASASLAGVSNRLVAAKSDSSHLLLAGVDPALRRAHAEALLGPVNDWDATHGGNLVPTVRMFLDSDGRWSEAASALGIHVNTLKHRLGRIAELSGKSVDRTADRVDLWIALAALGSDNDDLASGSDNQVDASS